MPNISVVNISKDTVTGSDLGSGKTGLDVKLASSDIAALSGGSYGVNNLDDSTSTIYIGKTKTGGIWLVEKFDESTGAKTYANHSNNGLIADYSDAWTNRATLTYGRFDEITGY